jgi:hypothetical protein
LTIICCCQVQNYIYWLISTENDHRHHHKFIKYEKRLRKEGNILGLPINNNQALPWVRSIQRQRSNWSPTYILHLFHLEDTSLLYYILALTISWQNRPMLCLGRNHFMTKQTDTMSRAWPFHAKTNWYFTSIPLYLWIRQSPLSSTRWQFLFCPRTTCCLLFLNSAHAQNVFA